MTNTRSLDLDLGLHFGLDSSLEQKHEDVSRRH
jgi:hypothetical protein